MKILHITNNYPTQKNPDYGVFTKDQIDNLKEYGVKNKLLFINAKENGIVEYFRAIKKIRRIYKNYDIIHCFHGLTLLVAFFVTFKKPILISFLNEIKYENFKDNFYTNKLFVLLYNLILKSKFVFAIFKDKISIEHQNTNRSFYLPNGVNLQNFHVLEKEKVYDYLNLDPKKRYILFVSSKDKMRTQKRYDIFKSTIKILKKEYPKYNFEELIMSGVTRKDCVYYYNAASIHLLVSNYEGSPNSVKESMSCNTPVVSTDVGNVKKMLSGSINCFISEQDPIVLAKYVVKALEQKPQDLRYLLKKKRLTVEDKTLELISIYKKILKKYDDFKT